MRRFVAHCDCGFAETFPTDRGARGALRRHRCAARFVEPLDAPHDDATVEGRIHAYTPLARRLAQRAATRYGIRYDDAYADALVGLWQAAERWTADGGASFATFAGQRIQGEILDKLRRDNSHGANLWRKGQRADCASLDELLDPENGSMSLGDMLPDEHDSLTQWWAAIDNAERACDARDRLDGLLAAVAGRNADRDRAIIRGHIDGRALMDVGAEHGLTEARASQIWRGWLNSVAGEDSPRYLRPVA